MGVKQYNLSLTPKQHQMIYQLKDVDEILYGGQAGPGKSDGILMFSLFRRLTCAGSVGLCLRRTFKELEKSLIRKSLKYYSGLGTYKEAKRIWFFPNGSIQEFGYCENDTDVYQYQSAEYDDVCFDELTHFTEFQYLYLMSRARTSGNWKFLIRAASNPGNIGHAWVKERFIDKCKDKLYEEFIPDLGVTMSRYFLTASLNDNTLMSKGKKLAYKSWLRSLPPAERAQLEHGDWDYVPNSAFTELRKEIHMINSKNPPERLYELFDFEEMRPRDGIKVFRVMDWGYEKPYAIYWAFSDYQGRIYIFKEMYGYSGINKGTKTPAREVAVMMKYYEFKKRLAPQLNVADSSIWDKPSNQNELSEKLPSIAETMAEESIYFDRELSVLAKRSRIQGKHQLHERLTVKDDGLPSLFIFDTCEHWWRTVPSLPLDRNNPEDIDTEAEDHAYDATRYMLSARPYKSLIKKPEDTPFTLSWYYKKYQNKSKVFA